LYKGEEFYEMLKIGVLILFFTVFLSSVPFKFIDFILSIVFGKENLILIEHHNLLDFRIVKWVMNFVIGIYTLSFSFFLTKETFTLSGDLRGSGWDIPLFLFGGIYILGIFTLGMSFIFANNYGVFALIWSLLLIVLPYSFLRFSTIDFLIDFLER